MTDLRDKYEVVIGLEVHAQLKTKSKIFAPDSTEFGNEQNTQISPITLGMPGVLPVLNRAVVDMGILTGLALNCEIANKCKFRKLIITKERIRLSLIITINTYRRLICYILFNISSTNRNKIIF